MDFDTIQANTYINYKFIVKFCASSTIDGGPFLVDDVSANACSPCYLLLVIGTMVLTPLLKFWRI